MHDAKLAQLGVPSNHYGMQDTRGAMLEWLAAVIECNAKERSKMNMDHNQAASHGFFVTFNAVLLKMCEPFLDPLSGKAWGKIDAGYVFLACS